MKKQNKKFFLYVLMKNNSTKMYIFFKFVCTHVPVKSFTFDLGNLKGCDRRNNRIRSDPNMFIGDY